MLLLFLILVALVALAGLAQRNRLREPPRCDTVVEAAHQLTPMAWSSTPKPCLKRGQPRAVG